jgi:carboxymethylenebutenolidase
MIEETVAHPTADGVADGVLFRPDPATTLRAGGDGRYPGVIHLADLGGIRPGPLAMAPREAEQGYVVLVPNVFYRVGRPPFFDSFPPDFADPRTQARFSELRAPLTPEAMERDASAYVDWLAAHASVAAGSMAVVGHCFTGAMALRTAAARPDRIAAAASFHGGQLYTDTPQSPHLVLPRVEARLSFGHAANDRSMPQDAIDAFNRALKSWGGTYESHVYEAAHGWTVLDGGSYEHVNAERAFEKLIALFRAALGR